MKLTNQQLKEIVRQANLVNEDQLNAAYQKAEVQRLNLWDTFLEEGLVSDENLGRLVAKSLGYKFINLKKVPIEERILQIIPGIVAKNRKVIAFQKDSEGLKVAMANPDDMDTVSLIQKKSGELVSVYYATERDILNTLSRYRKDLQEIFSDILRDYQEKTEAGGKLRDISIIKTVESIISYAYENKASDIHLEPQRNKMLVRYRIDGILHDIVNLPKEFEDLVVTRIKVLSRLRTDEHQAAQDGKFRFSVSDGVVISGQAEEKIDIRVSVIPITEGEKVVMRLLSAKSRLFGLEDLGLAAQDLRKVKEGFLKPYGMILTTGPTGCGKTTTLYAVLKILNTRKVNISTIEDPVEYDIEGVNQIQAKAATNLTFANGLRSILRQDPDVIMVGEIRDDETAGIAINAAMTGHLVLSTLHTNDASTALPRLLDMKIEPFLIASTINIIIAQRLVRKICSQCLVSYTVRRQELTKGLAENLIDKHFGEKRQQIRLYRGKGCKICSGTGYQGRIGVFEVLKVTETIRQLIMQQVDADSIRAKAIEEGMTTMLDDGLKKIVEAVTTIEEILRVVAE